MNRYDRLVIDASVATKWVIPEPDSDVAEALLVKATGSGTRLLAPELLAGEVANVIWKHSALRGKFSAASARAALLRILDAPLEIMPSQPLLIQAFELALTFRHPVYDCIYVALALREGCPLISADRPLVRIFGPATSNVIALDALDLRV